MIKILHYLKDPKLWEVGYIHYDGVLLDLSHQPKLSKLGLAMGVSSVLVVPFSVLLFIRLPFKGAYKFLA